MVLGIPFKTQSFFVVMRAVLSRDLNGVLVLE